ncbi:tripartite tricarboxylate transporter substrate binding protein [Acuticoccus sediminis]|nr:tripartite tricarboxylate transporter substrate binding protein [Acuticoccus sediminis]
MRLIALAAATFALSTSMALADWQPDGPIRLWIGFGAGGGTDTQGRALAKELGERQGWTVIPENKGGNDGAVMSSQLKSVEPDGQTLGFSIETTYTFTTIGNDNLSPEDFTYITTTAGSQLAIIVRASEGWTSLEDIQAAAEGGTDIVWANWGPQVQAVSELVARKLGISVNHLSTKGGRGAMDALMAMDANVAWGGGAQRALVDAGELLIVASGEDRPLDQAPDAPTLHDIGIDLTLGYRFVIVGPAGMDDEVRTTIADAVAEILNDPESETRKFIEKQYPPEPVVQSGDALTEHILATYEANVELMKTFAE